MSATPTSTSASAPSFSWRLLLPRWWPTWLAVGLIRVITWLPITWQLSFGEWLGRSLGRVAGKRREVVRTNLRLCFPELPDAERERLVDQHFAALGRGLFETALAWFASDARLLPRFEIEGQEHLEAARASGAGLLLLTGHFSTLEIGARIVCSQAGLPFHAMYRPYDNRVMDYLMYGWRARRSGLPALPRDDLRRLVKALREGHAIWYAPDQTLGVPQSVFAPFFGVPTWSVSATSRLANMGRARVLPYMPRRTAHGWCVRFLPMIEDFPGTDELVDTTRVNQTLEQGIRLAMPEYFWIHRRFKRRPPGAASVY
ncbi:LpxL/LpxP family Kdo(2)-lipid IV(A) lauroyl/palmitoleoyl acyltransferase [Panacagrimonas sp.]|uniref:LpxL/LpxP family Kdo(2)-lipid IV(A) lauroyl/palmitoleoyl acyltransferase n=1 Tax=Panacagrimonas sp. TaxID=2480088 RepID=UPI003B515A5F